VNGITTAATDNGVAEPWTKPTPLFNRLGLTGDFWKLN
jgi:hypothetical protein